MIVYEIENAKSISKREEETSRIRAKVSSPFPACSANPETNLDKNSVNIETKFLSTPLGSFFSKIIDFLCNGAYPQRVIPSLESEEAFVRGGI